MCSDLDLAKKARYKRTIHTIAVNVNYKSYRDCGSGPMKWPFIMRCNHPQCCVQILVQTVVVVV